MTKLTVTEITAYSCLMMIQAVSSNNLTLLVSIEVKDKAGSNLLTKI